MTDSLSSNLFSMVEIEIRDVVAIVTLNRPDKRNAINDDMRNQVIDALDRLNSDDAVRAMVLTGCLLYTSDAADD